LPEEKDDSIITTGQSDIVPHDDLDMAILHSIVEDARKSVLTIAEEIGHPARTVAYRLKLLEKNGIIKGYSININIAALGREYYKLLIVLSKNTSRAKLTEFAKMLDCTIFVDLTLSRFDFEPNLEVEDYAELQSIIQKIKEWSGGIQEISVFNVGRFHKLSHL
jgi:Lrp/AsnC family leucine-responsive transcriptional regulator